MLFFLLFFFCGQLSHVDFLQRKQNKSCLVLKGCIVGKSVGWTEGFRLTEMADGCQAATEPTEIEGYLLQQMGLSTFSTVIRG